MDITCNQMRRRAQLREAQARRRARLGVVSVSVELTKAQLEEVHEAKARFRGSPGDFLALALVRGALFVANSGTRPVKRGDAVEKQQLSQKADSYLERVAERRVKGKTE